MGPRFSVAFCRSSDGLELALNRNGRQKLAAESHLPGVRVRNTVYVDFRRFDFSGKAAL